MYGFLFIHLFLVVGVDFGYLGGLLSDFMLLFDANLFSSEQLLFQHLNVFLPAFIDCPLPIILLVKCCHLNVVNIDFS